MTFELSRKMLFWHSNCVGKSKSKSFFDIRTESENRILTFKILFWHSNWILSENPMLIFKFLFRHSNWVGKCYFGIQTHIVKFELSRKMLFSYSKSYFDIRTESEIAIIYIIKVLFSHSNRVGKSYFDIQNPILTFELSGKMLFWYWNYYFDIRTEVENATFAFKFLFWYSNCVGKSYLDIHNPILTFELSRKILFQYSKSYSDIRTESENRIQNLILIILTFELSRKILFQYSKSYSDIRTESENRILIFKILFWHTNWVGKYYFNIQNPILTFEQSRKIVFWYSKSYFDIRTERENAFFIFKIRIWHSYWVGKCYFGIQKPNLTFELSRKMLFCHSNSYCEIRTESKNAIFIFKILFWHTNWVGNCNFNIQSPILTFEQSRKNVFWYSKSYFDIRTQWGKCYFDIKAIILTFELSRKIVFLHSKSYFDIRTVSENAISIFKILFWHSNWVGKYDFGIRSHILTFELNRKILFWYLKSYFDIRTESENAILISKSYFDLRNESENRILMFKILFRHSNWVEKFYFDI